MWTFLLAAAVLWPGRVLSPLDGAPLNGQAEAVVIGIVLPVLWWLDGDFLGMPVRPIHEHGQVAYDLMIVATLESSGDQLVSLLGDGVPKEKLFPLRQHFPPKRKRTAESAAASNGDGG